MALRTTNPANEVPVGPLAYTTSSSAPFYMVAPVSGRLVRAYSILGTATATATSDWTWDVTVNDVAITGTATVTALGSAAGDVDSIVFSNPPRVNQEDKIGFVATPNTSSARAVNYQFVIRV